MAAQRRGGTFMMIRSQRHASALIAPAIRRAGTCAALATVCLVVRD